jgi:hypothetical protein
VTTPSAASSRRPALIALLSIVGVLLVIVAVIYFTKTAANLPSFFPGHKAGSATKHVKHGIAALVVGLICFAGAWFSLGSRPTSTGS